MKELIKKLIPNILLSLYHLTLAKLASYVYGFPSRQLIVIGVTGTKGKTTTANLLAKILEEAGHKVGLTSTLNFKIGQAEWLSDLKMTMPGRFYLQKLLRQMASAGCRFAVIETSSEGIAQSRHRGIWYDAIVFTNLSPEHIEAHGGFENYKQAKLELLRHLERSPRKKLSLKIIIANADNEHAADFLNFKVDKKITFGIEKKADFQAQNVNISEFGITYELKAISYKLSLLGKFDIYNSLAAIAAASAYGGSLQMAKTALEKVSFVPGRLEKIPNNRGLTVVVDYAYEPESLRQVFETLAGWKKNRIIHVLGPTGGGRDKWRRPVMGKLSAENSDAVIVTTDDPYSDDPLAIAREMALGAQGKAIIEIDRRQAIARALAMAKPGDLVLITGKGAEQVMAVAGGKIPWDDRKVVREELEKLVTEREKGRGWE